MPSFYHTICVAMACPQPCCTIWITYWKFPLAGPKWLGHCSIQQPVLLHWISETCIWSPTSHQEICSKNCWSCSCILVVASVRDSFTLLSMPPEDSTLNHLLQIQHQRAHPGTIKHLVRLQHIRANNGKLYSRCRVVNQHRKFVGSSNETRNSCCSVSFYLKCSSQLL
jgi:hypothetical protein